MADPGLLTDEEHSAVALLGELHGLLCRIVGMDASREGDMRELVEHIHALQQAVLSNAAARAYPQQYRLLGGTLGARHG